MLGERFLTPLGIQELRSAIRVEKKARYDEWAQRITC
jgi:hypothetical protein